MSASYVQKATAHGAGVTSMTTAGITTTTGNTVAVSIGSGPDFTSLTDNGTSNTVTAVAAPTLNPGGGQLNLTVKCLMNINGRAGHTFTANFSASDFVSMTASELAGVTASSLDVGSVASGSDLTSPYTLASNAFAQADEIVLLFNEGYCGGVSSYAESTGFTSIGGEADNNNYCGNWNWSKNIAATTALTPSLTDSGGTGYVAMLMVIAGFKSATATGITDAGQIASAQAFGAPVIGAGIAPAAIASAEAIGSAAIAAGIAPAGVASAQALGQPVVAANIGTTGIASAEGVGAPIVGTPAGVNAVGIASAEAFGQPALAAGIAATGAATGEALGTAGVAAAIDAAGVVSGEAFGLPVINPAGIFATGIPSGEAFGLIAISAGVSASSIASAEAVGQPSVGDASESGSGGNPWGREKKRRRAQIQAEVNARNLEIIKAELAQEAVEIVEVEAYDDDEEVLMLML